VWRPSCRGPHLALFKASHDSIISGGEDLMNRAIRLGPIIFGLAGGHSRMLYRALKKNLDVPTELCEYPGEPHGLKKMSNRKAKMEWDLAWFEKYLK